jgi:O-antigen/teichoic acid export membrane protein
MGSDHKKQTISSATWSIAERGFAQGANFVVTIVLARLLSPESFGVIGMVTVFIGLAQLLSDMGLPSAIIRQKDLKAITTNSIFWFNLLLGLLFSALFFVLAKPLGMFYSSPEVVPVAQAISLLFTLGALSSVQKALMRKNMKFKQRAIIEVSAVLVSSIVAIHMALTDFGIWSLVIKLLLYNLIATVLLWGFSEWRPQMRFSYNELKSNLSYSVYIALNGVLNYSSRNLDSVVIGRFLGSASLGIYNRSYSIMRLPVTNIGGAIGEVMFASFAIIQDDLPRLKRAYLKITWVLCFFTFPIVVFFTAYAEPFVLGVLGQKWVDMIFPLRILSISAIPQLILLLNGPVYKALGKPQIPLRINLILMPVTVGGYLLGMYLNGLDGLVISLLITYCLSVYPLIFFAGKLIDLQFIEQLKNLLGLLVFTIFQIMMGFALNELFGTEWLLSLLVGLLTISVSSYIFIRVFNSFMYEELYTQIMMRFKKGNSKKSGG